jgi:uncharacterized protein YjbI with pentapeptide repeats
VGVDISLRARWADLQGLDLKAALDEGQSPFGLTAAGLKDYRGIEIATVLSGVDASEVDFSYGVVGDKGQLGGRVRFLGCVFSHFKCDKTISGEFLECDFSQSNLSAAVFFGRAGSCRFDDSKLVGVRASQVVFDRCSFRGANLGKASLFDCRFEACVFDRSRWVSGSAVGSRFEACSFMDVTFRRLVTTRTTGLPFVTMG